MEMWEAQERLEEMHAEILDSIGEDMLHCPECNSRGLHTSLGTLGELEWYRCRDCGFDFFDDGEYRGPYHEGDAS